MELKHQFTVPDTLENTWRSFNQLEEIAPCFPGAVLTGVDGETFTGTVKIKLGPIAMLYAGTGEFLSRDEATHTVVISASGKDKRGNGTAGATVTAVLAASGDGTSVSVSTDMNVTGKPAQFGRGVIQDISDKLLEQFVQCVISKASAEPATEPATVASDETPAPESSAAALQGEAANPSPSVSEPAVREPATSKVSRNLAPPATELDLGSAMGPVLLRRFGPAILGTLATTLLVIWVARRLFSARRHRQMKEEQ
ncbi:SRPBCC domain-containing protein [Arthrobacter sp. GMC3]|uniref:SRPBCC domain-containing protein n=1 Tax=Arthrobacter sp. GMC3 TaxID=2058894 RepID=UPI000CE406B1|nr:SRPBCC domain-containing protein [Arthrobacter sp. GMC3]